MRAYEITDVTLQEDWKKKTAAALAAGALAGVPLTKYISDKYSMGLYDPSHQGREHRATQKYEPEHARTTKFYSKLQDIASKLQVNPNDLLKVMHLETIGTLNPSITNAIGATGLIQFMPNVARALGTSTEELKNMTATQQLDWVYKYFKMNKLPPGSTASDIYLMTFMPAVVRHKKPDNFVLGARKAYGAKVFGSIPASSLNRGSVWDQNPVFHEDPIIKKHGYFTVGDVRRTFEKKTQNVSL